MSNYFRGAEDDNTFLWRGKQRNFRKSSNIKMQLSCYVFCQLHRHHVRAQNLLQTHQTVHRGWISKLRKIVSAGYLFLAMPCFALSLFTRNACVLALIRLTSRHVLPNEVPRCLHWCLQRLIKRCGNRLFNVVPTLNTWNYFSCFSFLARNRIYGDQILKASTAIESYSYIKVLVTNVYIDTCRSLCVTYKTGSWTGWLDLFISGLQAMQRYRWSEHFRIHRRTRTRVLSLH
jgi:hypothetical protein